jgi:hypothetical protein
MTDQPWTAGYAVSLGPKPGFKGIEPGSYGIEAIDPLTPGALICGSCGRAWAEDITPAGRCPWEIDHAHSDGGVDTNSEEFYAAESRARDIIVAQTNLAVEFGGEGDTILSLTVDELVETVTKAYLAGARA